jgi:hypothetical protein
VVDIAGGPPRAIGSLSGGEFRFFALNDRGGDDKPGSGQ